MGFTRKLIVSLRKFVRACRALSLVQRSRTSMPFPSRCAGPEHRVPFRETHRAGTGTDALRKSLPWRVVGSVVNMESALLAVSETALRHSVDCSQISDTAPDATRESGRGRNVVSATTRSGACAARRQA